MVKVQRFEELQQRSVKVEANNEITVRIVVGS